MATTELSPAARNALKATVKPILAKLNAGRMPSREEWKSLDEASRIGEAAGIYTPAEAARFREIVAKYGLL